MSAWLGLIPWQVYAGVGALALLLLWGQGQYNRGWNAAIAAVEQKQRSAADAAGKEVDKLRSGDRSGVLQFDRD